MASEDGFSDFFYTSPDGLKLHARIYGTEPGHGAGAAHSSFPVVCLPGLTRNARDFHELALRLAGDPENPRRIICFDYRGRGQSAYDPNWQNYNVGIEAADIIAGLDALGIDQAAFRTPEERERQPPVAGVQPAQGSGRQGLAGALAHGGAGRAQGGDAVAQSHVRGG